MQSLIDETDAVKRSAGLETRRRLARAAAIPFLVLFAGSVAAQEVLPFPEPGSASTAGKTLKDSKHQWRKAENHLPEDAPNIVIFMTDDAGFANPSTFGGPIQTPTLDRLANSGISYNAFHTTAHVLRHPRQLADRT